MKVIIYGKSGCPACNTAIALCESKSIPYDYHTVGFDITKEQLEEKIGRQIKTVPQIFIMNHGFAEYIGSLLQLRQLI